MSDWKEMVERAREIIAAKRPIARPENHACLYCGASLNEYHPMQRMCGGCASKRSSLQNKAAFTVYRAVKAGLIPAAHTLQCVDCGKPAQCWDHRNYDEPMVIEPTCRGCNKTRGPALAPSIAKAA